MKSCIYVETTTKNNCPELCPLFCANDDVVLSGFQPNIVFERNETIAKGSDQCDFHFHNRKMTNGQGTLAVNL
jgi:predicted ArsR family transcriptional regulator